MYRSDDGGAAWTEITGALPTDFGFVIGAHPRDPDTAWVIPLTEPTDGRFVPDAKPAVWRTGDRGGTWQRQDRGLPPSNAWLSVLREAMGVDALAPAGVYFGTQSGEVWGSADEGGTWAQVADHLPAIASVDVAVVER